MRNAGSIALEEQISSGRTPKDRSSLGYDGSTSKSEKATLNSKIVFVKSSEEFVKRDQQFAQDRHARDSAHDRSLKENFCNRKSTNFRSSVRHNSVFNTDNFFSKSQDQGCKSFNQKTRNPKTFRKVTAPKHAAATGRDKSQGWNHGFSKIRRVPHYQSFHFHEWGHIRRFCRHLLNQNFHQRGELRRPLS